MLQCLNSAAESGLQLNTALVLHLPTVMLPPTKKVETPAALAKALSRSELVHQFCGLI